MKKRLDLLLVYKKLAESRSKAQAMIMAGQVFVGDKKITKSGENFGIHENIFIEKLQPHWVSRGAYKLLHAIEYFKLKIDNLICLDIGASTGGFTEVLMKKNAKKIYALDVGKNQMHERLKKQKNIINLEKTNARYISSETIPEVIDLIVCDASFISLKKVLDKPVDLLDKKKGILVALIKPQFEAKKNEIKKGGVVKDKEVHARILNEIKIWLKTNYQMNILGTTKSPIRGTKGNVEYLICAKYNSNKS